MFAFIKGKLDSKNINFVIVEAGGIGYRIFMPTSAIERLPEIGAEIKIHTYYYVREDNISLYGFNTLEELRMFELLLSVSGIGAKSAIVVVSEMTPSKFALDVISEDVSSLVKVPGIGKKTAQRVILELKDKMKTESAIAGDVSEKIVKKAISDDNVMQEAMAALLVLGYQRKEIENVLTKINEQGLGVEDLIKRALVILSR